MKQTTASAILAIVAFSSGSLAALSLDIAKAPAGTPKLSRRKLSPRASITESLANNVTGGSYMVTIQVGSPGQTQTLAVDTGSSDVWIFDVDADVCSEENIQEEEENGCLSSYDPSKSSTYKIGDENAFSIKYGDGTGAIGDYITDNLVIGGATIKSLEMGLAYNATLFQGLLGIGYDVNEASDAQSDGFSAPFIYPSIIDQMVSQGIISSKAYSLYLNDLDASTGSIIFGGIDTDKFHGDLLQIPIVPDQLQNGSSIFAEFAVALTSFSITGEAGNTTDYTASGRASQEQTAVILDSGTTLSYVPEAIAEFVYKTLNAYDDSKNSGVVFVDCDLLTSAPKTTLNFGFGGSDGVTITIPIDEVILPISGVFSSGGGDGSEGDSGSVSGPFASNCILGINSQSSDPYILGDTFLRSAYVVYDLTNNVIGLAQTNFNSTTSSIVDFQADATAIPNISGVASSVAVTETATSKLPVGGGHATTTNSGASTESTSSSTTSPTGTATSHGAAVGSVPAFDGSAFLVLGFAGLFAMLGGGWMLA